MFLGILYFLLFSLVEKQLSSAQSTLLSFLPFLFLLKLLQDNPVTEQDGRSLRINAYSEGIISHILYCLSQNGHYEQRKRARATSPAPSDQTTSADGEKQKYVSNNYVHVELSTPRYIICRFLNVC